MDHALAEAMSLREALSWLKNHPFPSVNIELDSLKVVQAVQSPVDDRSLFGNVIEDCKLLLSKISLFKIFFIRRSAKAC